jgi:hypothetical protein
MRYPRSRDYRIISPSHLVGCRIAVIYVVARCGARFLVVSATDSLSEWLTHTPPELVMAQLNGTPQ